MKNSIYTLFKKEKCLVFKAEKTVKVIFSLFFLGIILLLVVMASGTRLRNLLTITLITFCSLLVFGFLAEGIEKLLDLRKTVHFFYSLLFLACWLLFNHISFLLMTTYLFFVFIFITPLLPKIMIEPFTSFFEAFKEIEKTPTIPVISFLAGLLFSTVTSLTAGLTDVVPVSLLTVSFGDCSAYLVGRKGKTRLPYNKSKTVEGTIAGTLSSLAAVTIYFAQINPLLLLSPFTGMVAESIVPTRRDGWNREIKQIKQVEQVIVNDNFIIFLTVSLTYLLSKFFISP